MPRQGLLKKLVIAIDGPSGSGKTTTAMLVAQELGLLHIDTGAMYRAVTLKALEDACDLSDGDKLGSLASALKIEFGEDTSEGREILVNGENVAASIRTPEVTNNVSLVSSHPQVRVVMATLQRRIAAKGGVVLEGRDIGSVILPSAHVKIFLLASIEVRAKRRFLELKNGGMNVDLDEVAKQIEERDRFDSTREISPLKMPVGAKIIDTSELTIEGQVDEVIACAEKVLERLEKLAATADFKSDAMKISTYFRIGQLLIRNVCKLFLGLKIIKLESNHYDENYIFACNHLSYADPPLVGSTLPRELHFMAKQELFRFKPFAWLIKKYHAIPLKRSVFDKEALETALAVLKNGKSMMIFPEGTRSKNGVPGRPKSGAGYLAINANTPVVPVYVQGSNRLFKAFFRAAKLVVVIGSPIRLTEEDTSKFANNESYRNYSEMVMEAIGALKEYLPL